MSIFEYYEWMKPLSLIDCMLHIPLAVHRVELHRSNWFLTRTHLHQPHQVDYLVDHSNHLWYACPAVHFHFSPIIYSVVVKQLHRVVAEKGKIDWNINVVGFSKCACTTILFLKSEKIHTNTMSEKEKERETEKE